MTCPVCFDGPVVTTHVHADGVEARTDVPCGYCGQDDWPRHQPAAPDAPIPGRQWYGGCEDGYPRVDPATGVCEGCGGVACRVCGCEFYPDGGCRCR